MKQFIGGVYNMKRLFSIRILDVNYDSDLLNIDLILDDHNKFHWVCGCDPLIIGHGGSFPADVLKKITIDCPENYLYLIKGISEIQYQVSRQWQILTTDLLISVEENEAVDSHSTIKNFLQRFDVRGMVCILEHCVFLQKQVLQKWDEVQKENLSKWEISNTKCG